MKDRIDGEAIIEAWLAQATLAATGVSRGQFEKTLRIDSDSLREVAREAADEEFTDLSEGSVPERLEKARLRAVGLNEDQEKAVRDALVDTFIIAFDAGVLLGQALEKDHPIADVGK